jgi:RHS repeat-associated protein
VTALLSGLLKETWEGKKPVTDEYMYEYTNRGDLYKVTDAKTNRLLLEILYDKNGNRTGVYSPHHKYNGGELNYDSQDRLVSYRDYRYEYTENGALSKKRDVNETAFDASDDLITTYSYDQGGNLLKVNLPNNDEIRYTSDALNRRIAKMKNGNYEYKLLYSGQLSPIARLDAYSRVVEEYVYGSRVNVPEYMIKDGRKYRFITDHRGSVRMVVDTHTGDVMQRTDYDEFGYIIDEDLAENWTPVLFGYAGGLQDRDTGFIRFGARDYDPVVGRWTSKEPLGFNGSSNFYTYANNDPVNKVDIDGRLPLPVLTGLVGGLVGGASNITVQLVQSGGDFGAINWSNVGIATASGAISGALGPWVSTSLGLKGLAALGAATNLGQYSATQVVNDEEITVAGVCISVSTGAFGAIIGGKVPYPQYTFSSSADDAISNISPSVARSLNNEAYLSTAKSGFWRNFLGGLVSNY